MSVDKESPALPRRKSAKGTGSERPRPFYLIWQAGLAFQTVVNAFGREEGVALKKYIALLYISRSDALTASQLSRRLATSPQSANELVGSLETGGLVCKSPSQTDRRTLHLSLTDEGRRYLAETERAIDKAEEYLLRGLSPALLDEMWPTLTMIVERGRNFGSN